MNWVSYDEWLKSEKSDIFGKMFSRSVDFGYNSCDFVKELMTNPELEDMVFYDERTEWCDECFLLRVFENMFTFKKGETLDKYLMWFLGYLYKYWMRSKNMKPKEVYKILPVEEYLKRYAFYHTQGWYYIINDATDEYIKNSKNNSKEGFIS